MDSASPGVNRKYPRSSSRSCFSAHRVRMIPVTECDADRSSRWPSSWAMARPSGSAKFVGPKPARFWMAVGSRTGAVAPRFRWECLTIRTVTWFPAPATSHVACGFPALRAPAHFTPRLWDLSDRSNYRDRLPPAHSVLREESQRAVQPFPAAGLTWLRKPLKSRKSPL
jgi:hypothetical protein